MQAKKLIEVAMPIKEISAESVRDKSIRHGHISTLHLWWARRPLPVCRAVVFASLVPDPEDENCPQAFRDACSLLLGQTFDLKNGDSKSDWYKPYDDIPYTSAIDRMEDTLRNRLMMFIGKFSDKYIQATKQGKSVGAKDMLSDASLIKWDNKNDENIIGKARKLIWVAHNAASGKSAKDLLAEFDTAYKAIKDAEHALYSLPDRHLESVEVKTKDVTLQQAIYAFQDKMPKVFDPFAGGGAIPLEAARLGCMTYGNDINPVAHIIQKGSLEFPQKYGKPITHTNVEFEKLYGKETLKTIPNEWKTYTGGAATGVRIPNRLSFDVEFYAKKLLEESEKKIGHLYPVDKDGNKPIAYYWVKVGTCSNPSCKAEVPLLKGFYLVKTSTKQIYLKPIINGKKIDFEIMHGEFTEKGWMSKNLICPCCGSTTSTKDLKEQAKLNSLKERFIAVISESKNGKSYRLPTESEFEISVCDRELINPLLIPNEDMNEIPDLVSGRGWGIKKWSQMFSVRQLITLQNLVNSLNEQKSSLLELADYGKALITYLGILIDRIIIKQVSFIAWDSTRETIGNLFGRQAIPMIFDYPESNPFSGSSGSASNAIDWIIRYIESESGYSFATFANNASSGEKTQFDDKSITAVITDPPYYDAIAYADLSDFFYVWLKKTLGDIYPMNFATPQTPKTEECTALKHYHCNSKEEAKAHFEFKLTQIFDAIEHQTSDIVSIMFAHQSTEAWTTLCNSVLGARMNITGSWPIETEMANRTLGLTSAVLASSVTVSAKPSQRHGYGEYREVKKAIEKTVAKEVEELYRLGFRGADLLTACFGQAVSEFGKYEKVEKANGSEVTVAELLEMARESAFNALLKGFEGDDFTKFYIAWLQLYSFAESDFDDAAKFSRVGLSINVQELFTDHILIKNGNKQALCGYKERIGASKNLGDKVDSHLIDQVHRCMHLYQTSNRGSLLEYIHKVASNPDSPFWRVVSSLSEILPNDPKKLDLEIVKGLITNKESLIRDSATAQKEKGIQTKLFE